MEMRFSSCNRLSRRNEIHSNLYVIIQMVAFSFCVHVRTHVCERFVYNFMCVSNGCTPTTRAAVLGSSE